jgi:hypothetical protein
VLVLRPKTIRHGTSCASRCNVKVTCGDRKPCTKHASESVKTRHHSEIQGNVQLQGCAVPYRMAPCLLGWMCRFCTVRGWSRHDLAMNWEWYASVFHVFYKVIGDFGSKLEVHMRATMLISTCFMNICSIMYRVARRAMPYRPWEYR